MNFDEKIRKVAADQHGVVSRQQFHELGVTPNELLHRLRRGEWTSLSPRVLRLSGAPVTDRSRVLAAVLDAGHDAAASHRTAAWLWGLPGFGPGNPEVTRPRGRGRERPSLAFVHEPRLLPGSHATVVDGIPVTTASRTIFDLAGVLHPARTERALDNALARSPALLPVLHRMLPELAQRGRPGIRLMRALLDARPSSYVAPASGVEARAIALLAEGGYEARRQVDVGSIDWIGRVDLVIVGTDVIVEVDSALHHTSQLDRARDAKRDAELRAAGYRPVRVTDDEVFRHPRRVLTRVGSAVLAA